MTVVELRARETLARQGPSGESPAWGTASLAPDRERVAAVSNGVPPAAARLEPLKSWTESLKQSQPLPASPPAAAIPNPTSPTSPAHATEPLEVLLPGKALQPGESFADIARQSWRALRRYRVLVFACILAALAMAGWLIAHRRVYYVASASIELRRRLVGRRTKDEDGNESGVQARSGELYSMRGDALLAQVAEEVGLLPPLDAQAATHTEAGQAARAARNRTLSLLRGGLMVTADGRSNLVRVQYTSTDPQFAAELVNRLTDDFVDGIYRKRLTASNKIVEWQLGQLGSLKDEAEVDERRMLTLQRALGLPGFNTQYNHFEETLKEMQRQADDATLRRITAEARYQVVAHAGQDQALTPALLLTPSGAPTPAGATPLAAQSALTGAQLQVNETEQQLAQTRVELGARNPRVLALQARLNEVRSHRDQLARGLVQQAQSALQAARLEEAETRNTLDTEVKRVNDQAQTNTQFVAAQRAFLEARYLYTQEYLKLRGAGFTSGLKESPVEIIDRAYAPLEGEKESAWRIALTWLTYGLLTGVVLALGLENLRGGVRSLADAEQMLDLPGLISLPASGRGSLAGEPTPAGPAAGLAILREPQSAFTLALHLLASTLVLRDADLTESAAAGIGFGPDKLLLFTSATPSEGKTTVACNMAVALAQRGRRVLLIDADLRRPAVHHRLGLSGRIGLSTVLTGKAALAQALQSMPGVPGLDVLGSGPIPPVSSALIDSPAFAALLGQAAEQYAHVIVDSPPVLAVADAVQLARLADAVLLVVRHGKVARSVVRRARDVLAFANVPLLGIVLNAVPEEQPERAPVREPATV